MKNRLVAMGKFKFDFHGKNVVITGASRGIGLAMAESFAESGANVMDLSRSGNDRKSVPGIYHVDMDVTDIRALEKWISKFGSKNKIDIWVNNAGVYTQSLLLDVSEKEWNNTFDTNLKSMFFASVAAARHMKANSKGIIVNAASFAAKIPSVGSGVYAATKAAVVSMTKSMAAEWARFGIRVNSYSPGVILTDMTKEVVKKGKGKDKIALARYGNPDEVANAVMFLCSDSSSYITGANLEITGGKFIVQNQDSGMND
jgi:NAD(P)-dependent dehydrogenase (short-subunit alcohol dehydrogenase family)